MSEQTGNELHAGVAAPKQPVVMRCICPDCGEKLANKYGTSQTLVGYFSEPGHDHDDNCRNRVYECKNGHRFEVSKQNKCPSCDWVGKKTCFCCDGEKVAEWPSEAP